MPKSLNIKYLGAPMRLDLRKGLKRCRIPTIAEADLKYLWHGTHIEMVEPHPLVLGNGSSPASIGWIPRDLSPSVRLVGPRKQNSCITTCSATVNPPTGNTVRDPWVIGLE